MKYRLLMKKVMAAACCAMLLCLLAGCQLAQENAGPNANGDRLIGVYVTTEYIDLFDFDSYMSDNLNGFLSGGEMVVDGNSQKYAGRLYAELVTKTIINSETGEPVVEEDYVFEGIDGSGYYAPTIPATADHESYHGAMCVGDAISDRSSNIDVNGDTNSLSTSMEGTIYVSPGSETTFYFNPVYQGADSRVYLVSSSGFFVSNETHSEGAVFSQSMDETYTTTENGKVKTERVSVKVSVAYMFAPEKIIIVEMGANSEPLSRKEYASGALPETLAPGAGTDYIIVEANTKSADGNVIKKRDLYGKEDSVIETFSARADRICVKHETQIEWAK